MLPSAMTPLLYSSALSRQALRFGPGTGYAFVQPAREFVDGRAGDAHRATLTRAPGDRQPRPLRRWWMFGDAEKARRRFVARDGRGPSTF